MTERAHAKAANTLVGLLCERYAREGKPVPEWMDSDSDVE